MQVACTTGLTLDLGEDATYPRPGLQGREDCLGCNEKQGGRPKHTYPRPARVHLPWTWGMWAQGGTSTVTLDMPAQCAQL